MPRENRAFGPRPSAMSPGHRGPLRSFSSSRVGRLPLNRRSPNPSVLFRPAETTGARAWRPAAFAALRLPGSSRCCPCGVVSSCAARAPPVRWHQKVAALAREPRLCGWPRAPLPGKKLLRRSALQLPPGDPSARLALAPSLRRRRFVLRGPLSQVGGPAPSSRAAAPAGRSPVVLCRRLLGLRGLGAKSLGPALPRRSFVFFVYLACVLHRRPDKPFNDYWGAITRPPAYLRPHRGRREPSGNSRSAAPFRAPESGPNPSATPE